MVTIFGHSATLAMALPLPVCLAPALGLSSLMSLDRTQLIELAAATGFRQETLETVDRLVTRHVHPWFESLLSSNGSIIWGASLQLRVVGVRLPRGPGRESGRGSRCSTHRDN
jgi:hypothetical protein